MDLTGNGLTDLLWIEKQSSSNSPKIRWQIAGLNSAGTISYPGILPVGITMDAAVESNGTIPQLHTVDINGDGRNELLYAIRNGSDRRFVAHFWNGSGFGPPVTVGTYSGFALKLEVLD